MPEMRRNPITKSWSIIASERSKRPEMHTASDEKASQTVSHDANCFFCEGNEHTTPPEVYAIRKNSEPDTKGWEIRVVPNKFAAVNLDNDFVMNPDNPINVTSWARGVAEVIVETQDHSKNIALLTQEEVAKVLKTYVERYKVLAQIPSNKYIQIFRNNGIAAGASISHPHSQIITIPVVPIAVNEEILGAADYYELTGRCVFCDIIGKELADRARIIYETENFLAFEQFASRVPFETWIVPKFHSSSFDSLSDDLVVELSEVWRSVLYKLYKGLNNPPYNYFIHTSPVQKNVDKYYHWHLEIIPKLTIPAGFELGTGMYINTAIPEESAEFLRKIV